MSEFLSQEYQNMIASSVAHDSQLCFNAIAEYQTLPSTLFRPKITIDGNQWCALYGDNLQDGVAGFGDTPWKAVQDFNKNFLEQRL